MLPVLIEAFGAAPDPMRAMNRFDDLVIRLPSGVNFYRLLEARPALTEHLAAILSHAPALAEQLGRRPQLLDGLIDASAFAPARAGRGAGRATSPAPTAPARIISCCSTGCGGGSTSAASRSACSWSSRTPIRSRSTEGYSRVAEAAISVLADATVAEFEAAHGRVPGSELLILGLGRLGGEALTHASDLDLVYLFSGTHEAESDGPKPLRATDYFNRLAPRVTAALSVPTAAGPLYDVDTRLRPSGKDGLLAVSLESFARYQQRAGLDLGAYGADPGAAGLRLGGGAGGAAGGDRRRRSAGSAIPAKLVADAVAMRAEMDRHKPPSGPFDIKLGAGGLVDLEFAVHTLQLRPPDRPRPASRGRAGRAGRGRAGRAPRSIRRCAC